MFWKKKQFWGSIVAVGLLAYCVKDIRLAEIRDLAGRVNYLYFLLAVMATFTFYILRALRWRLILSTQKRIGVVRAITLYSAGQVLNSMMPALTGQVGRIFLFASKEDLRKTFIFSTIVLELLFDAMSLVVLLLITSLAFTFPSEYRVIGMIATAATVAALIGLYLILHFQAGLEEFGRRRFRSRWPGVYITLKKFIRSFVKGMILLRSSQHLFGSLLYSVGSWVSHLAVVYFLFVAFDFGLPLATAAVVMLLNQVAVMVPITPGNAGTFEVVVSTSLAAFSIGRSDAVLFALALHLLDLLPVFVLGYVFMRQERALIKRIKEQHQDEIIFDKLSEEGNLIETEEQA